VALELPKNLRVRDGIYSARLSIEGRDYEKSLETYKLSEAKKLLRPALEALRAEARKPKVVEVKTFGDLIHAYRIAKAQRLRERTHERWEFAIQPLIRSIGLATPVSEITMQKVVDFEMGRAADCVAVSTLKLELMTLGSLLRFAEDMEWPNVKNHVPGFMRTRSKTILRHDSQRVRYLVHAEEESALSHLRAIGRPDDADMVAFAIDTGLRRQEMFNTVWSSWDKDRNEIMVTAHLAKNRKPRYVPLLPRARAILQEWERRKIAESDYIFGGSNFVPPQRAQQITGRLLEAGIEDLTWHDLRRTCGCRLLQDHKLEPLIVSQWLGHSDLSITLRAYAFLHMDALHEALAQSKIVGRDRPRIMLGET
jgi:integrase